MPFQIVRNDIAKMNTDVIVKLADSENGNAETCGAKDCVVESRGVETCGVESEQATFGDICVIPTSTNTGKFVFQVNHTSYVDGKSEEEKLRQCYARCLQLAVDYECESIALPILVSKQDGLSRELSISIAKEAIRRFLMEQDLQIYLVISDSTNVKLSGAMFDAVADYVDHHYVDRQFSEQSLRSMPSQTTPTSAMPLAATAMPMPSVASSTENSDEKSSSKKDSHKKESSKKDLDKKDSNKKDSDEANSGKKKFSISSLLRKNKLSESGGNETSRSSVDFEEAEPCLEEANVDSFIRASASVPRSIQSLASLMNEDVGSFAMYLQQLINKKGMTNALVYKKANLTKQYFSKLMNGKVNPTKEKLLCIAVALELNMDEAVDFLRYSGYAFSPYSKTDLVFQYFIMNGNYDIYSIDIALFDYGLPSLMD